MAHRTAALLQLAAAPIAADALDCWPVCMPRSAAALLLIAVHRLHPAADTPAVVIVVVVLDCWLACTPRKLRDARALRIAAHPLPLHPAADTLAVAIVVADCSRSCELERRRVVVAALPSRAVHQLAVAMQLQPIAVAMPLLQTVVVAL